MRARPLYWMSSHGKFRPRGFTLMSTDRMVVIRTSCVAAGTALIVAMFSVGCSPANGDESRPALEAGCHRGTGGAVGVAGMRGMFRRRTGKAGAACQTGRTSLDRNPVAGTLAVPESADRGPGCAQTGSRSRRAPGSTVKRSTSKSSARTPKCSIRSRRSRPSPASRHRNMIGHCSRRTEPQVAARSEAGSSRRARAAPPTDRNRRASQNVPRSARRQGKRHDPVSGSDGRPKKV